VKYQAKQLTIILSTKGGNKNEEKGFGCIYDNCSGYKLNGRMWCFNGK
jgi:hypothetical protein